MKILKENIFPLGFLILVNLMMFHLHYWGIYTFPWDFLGGYHTHSFAWFTNGSIFNPPQWFAWGNVGFPSALAIQSGSWYFPLAILDFLNITYSIKVATIVQCLHVLFGSMGIYFLLRVFSYSIGMALLGALGFQLSGGFYSNAQHVDIIRAYALLPWVLWSLHPHFLFKSAFRPFWASLLLFQFLVAAYPGNIAAAVYGCFVFCLFHLVALPSKKLRIDYALTVFIIAISAVFISSVKWFPYFLSLDVIEITRTGYNHFLPWHFLTLMLDYDVTFIPGDISMRSLYIPLVILAGLFFIKEKTISSNIGFAFVILALVLGGIAPAFWPQLTLPGLTFSRFPLTDWRIFLYIGLILLSVAGWTTLFSKKLEKKEIFCRIFLMMLTFVVVIWIATDIGYQRGNFYRTSRIFGLIILLIALFVFFFDRLDKKKLIGFYSLLALILIVDGWKYHYSQPFSWKTTWSKEIEFQLFDLNFSDLDPHYRKSKKKSISQRPGRLIIKDGNEDFAPYINSSHYNKCWYQNDFCLFGYDNLHRQSIPHRKLFSSLLDPQSGKKNLNFVLRPQQLLIFDTRKDFNILDFPEGDSEFLSLVPNVSASSILYSPEKVVYKIASPKAVQVVENELWWPGWRVRLCQNSVCSEALQTNHTQEYLRTWEVPPGEWVIELTFHQKGLTYSRFAFLGGMGMILAFCLYRQFVRRVRRNKIA